jgi:CRISPR-associated endonuclease Cas1
MFPTRSGAAERTALRGTLLLTGYGIRLAVERGHLIAEDGCGTERASARFPRVGHGLRRVFIIGNTGSLSLEALRWLADVGIPFVNFDHDHRIIALSPVDVLNDVRVRRGQALAPTDDVGLAVTRRLLMAKLDGQRRVLDRLPQSPKAIDDVEAARNTLEHAETLDAMQHLEAMAALAYWDAWERMPVQFAAKDQRRIPAHWQYVGTRRSLLNVAGAHHATSPANAIRNYLYGLLEAEARLASWAVGLDPELGILHLDRRARASFACDLMEPVRPDVDDYVFELLQTQTFSRTDFFERHDGHCRLMPSLARPLARTAARWMKAVAPFAEEVADACLTLGRERAVKRSVNPPLLDARTLPNRTPLTQRRARQKDRKDRSTTLGSKKYRVLYRCRTCGVDLGDVRREYCATHWPDRYADSLKLSRATATVRGSEGRDKRSAKSVRTRHAEAAHDLWRRKREWETTHGGRPSKDMFRARFTDRLRQLRTRELVDATGLTFEACNGIRRGAFVPHPMHWDAIERAVSQIETDAPTRGDLTTPDYVRYEREIAPNVATLSVAAIQRATGLGGAAARKVREGIQIPRPHHWAALKVILTNTAS